MWLRGIFPGVSWPRPPSVSPPGLHVPLGSGLQAKVGAGAAQKPIPSPDWRAAHSSGSPPSSSADLQKFFLLQLRLRRGLLPGSLWASALWHDVGNLRQWAPRRDFIRFWRYVDCNIQWLHGAPPFVASKTSMRSCPQGIWPLTTGQSYFCSI